MVQAVEEEYTSLVVGEETTVSISKEKGKEIV